MLINLIDKNCVKIILFLAISPGNKYNRKEILEKINMNNVPFDNSLRKLVNLKIINKGKYYSLNLENNITKIIIEERKKISNLPIKIQFILLDIIETLSKFQDLENVFLFGSYSKLIFTDNSDIDIAIIFGKTKNNQTNIEKNMFNKIEKISKIHKKEIELHYFNKLDLKHKEDPLIKDLIKNNIILI